MAFKVNVLGVPVDPGTLSQARERVFSLLEEEKPGKSVFSINPEIVIAARKDEAFAEILKGGDLNLPDGVGIVWASRLLGKKVPDRVAGYDLVRELLPECARRKLKIFLLGGRPGVSREAKIKMENEFPGLNIVGTNHGYFTGDEIGKIREELQKADPDILLVGLGFPRQERFINEHAREIGIPVSIAVGGTLDGLAGKTKRAPKIFRRLGLEWLYRIVSLRRWDRFLSLPYFAFLVLWEKLRGGTIDA